MPKNSVKRQPDMETDIRRSVVVLRFPFGSGPDEPKGLTSLNIMLLVYRLHHFRWTIAGTCWRQACRYALTGAHAATRFDWLHTRRDHRARSYSFGRGMARARREGSAAETEVEGVPRVLVVGAGTRFLSAMSYYTIRLTNALG